MSYKKQKLLTRREYLGSPPVCGEVRIAHLFSFLFSVFFDFVCLRPMSYVRNVAIVSVLLILDCHFGFL